jgi:hypothetical protein
VVGAPASEAYTLHYDGSSWRKVSVPWIGNYRHLLNDVHGIASNDVWAVGTWGSTTAPGRFIPWIVHWNGSAWEHIPLPQTLTDNLGELLSVRMVSHNDVWATGYYLVGGIVSIHWDGTSWSEVNPHTSGGDFTFLNASDGYAVGGDVRHWDGTSWTIADTLPGLPYPSLTRVVRLPNGEIWSSGRTVDNLDIFRTLVYRFGADNQPAMISASSTQIQPGSSAQLRVQMPHAGNYSYAWSPGQTLDDSTSATPTASPMASTQYFVSVTDSLGNSVERTIVITVAGPVAVHNSISSSPWSIAPNPFSDRVEIAHTTGKSGDALVTLRDASGKVVYSKSHRFTEENQPLALPTQTLHSGIYFLSVQSGDAVYQHKLIRE